MNFRKLTSLLVAVMIVFGAFGAVSANAETVDQLMQMIKELQAKLNAAQGSSAAVTFTKTMSVGSRGTEVEQLQNMLNDTVDAGLPVTGYFGPLTKKAVIKFQKEYDIPGTGTVGPLTRAKLNELAAASTPTTPTTPTEPATTTPTTPTTGVGEDTDGSVTMSRDNYVSNQTLKKGETKDVYAVKLQATAGKVAVTRFDVRLNVRPWLYFNKLTLKDSNGTVIAEKAISSASDATELTVGSDYLVRFENLNYVVEPGNSKVLVVSASVLPTTDKLTSDVSVTVQTGSNGVRTINGKGYTDSLSETSGRTVTLSSTGSIGNIVGRLNSNSPIARIQTVTTSGETAGVILGVFDLKSENLSSTINSLKFGLNSPAGQRDFPTLFKRVYLVDGDKTYSADTIASTTIFTNLTIDLAKDAWKTLTLKADVADADDFVNGSMASTSLVVNPTNINGIDANYTTVKADAGNTVAASDVTFLQSGASLSNLGATASTPAGANGVAGSTSTVAFTFTINNTGSNDIYVSKSAPAFVATSTNAMSGALTSVTSATTLSGDAATYFVIPSGTSRAFTVEGTYGNDNGTAGLKEFKITKINFGDSTSALQTYGISAGLESLRVNTYQNN